MPSAGGGSPLLQRRRPPWVCRRRSESHLPPGLLPTPVWPCRVWGVRHGQEEEEDRKIRIRQATDLHAIKRLTQNPGWPRETTRTIGKRKREDDRTLNMKRNQMTVN